MKRRFFIFSLIFVFAVNFSFADFGVGGEQGFDVKALYKPYSREFLNVSFRFDENPWCLSANVWIFDDIFDAKADNWFVNEPLSKTVSWYGFWGVNARVGFEKPMLAMGGRLGAGIDWFLLDRRELEIFWQGAWSPYLGAEKDDDWQFMIRPLCFEVASGVRWWFR